MPSEFDPKDIEKIVEAKVTQSTHFAFLPYASKDVADAFLKAQTQKQERENRKDKKNDGVEQLKEFFGPFVIGIAAGGLIVGEVISYHNQSQFIVFSAGSITSIPLVLLFQKLWRRFKK